MQCTPTCKRTTIAVITAVALVALAFIFLNQWYEKPVKSEDRIKPRSISTEIDASENVTEIQEINRLNEIREDIDLKRMRIRQDMTGFSYPNGKYNISATKLEDLVIEKNGNPVRSLILSTFRSGSSFFGDIVRSYPGDFYYFEPLAHLTFDQIERPPISETAIRMLKSLLKCDYSEQDDFIKYEQKYRYVFKKTTHLWKDCKENNSKCYDQRYLSSFCKLFPYQTMKIVRLRLSLAEELLADESLAVRVVFLARDPRGTMQSRKHVFFYNISQEIRDPASLCEDLVSDYDAAVELQEKYPTTFRVLRYEDLAADPYKHAEELMAFFGRDFHPKVKQFLDTHTTANGGDVFATTRNSRTTPYHWRNDLEFGEVEEIQRVCNTAMELWGYLPAINATHLGEFHPVTNYTVSRRIV